MDRDGTFHQAPNPAMMYATLIPERLSLVDGKKSQRFDMER
jgi:acyl-CoA oxidase